MSNKVKAQARHILVAEEADCKDLINRIKDGEDFAKLAAEFSKCPSGKRSGGDLGEFSPGMMVKAFDDVIFDPNNKPGTLYPTPVKTQFGWHVIEVTARG
jgi:peptidyl-prolyl cis-trans isomerase C